nr:transporter substrate-binding domain-containing protein [Janibacter limosus]
MAPLRQGIWSGEGRSDSADRDRPGEDPPRGGRPCDTREPPAGTAALTPALTLAACGDSGSDGASEGGGDHLAELQDKGTITVAFAGEDPYSFEKDGELTGATIALHKQIFKELGINEVKGVKTEWAALIPGLKAGRLRRGLGGHVDPAGAVQGGRLR